MKKLLVVIVTLVFMVVPTISYAVEDTNGIHYVRMIGENKINFKEQILASFVGTFLGFIFALILFFITNKLIESRNKKMLLKHLKREFEYDITQIQGWIDEIDKILRKITAKDPKVFSYLKYSYFSRGFMQQAFNSGIMYNKLNDEEISQLNTILSHCDIGYENYINSLITRWKSGSIEQTDVLSGFEFEKDSLTKYKQELDGFIKKMNK